MKKLIALILSLVMLGSLTACAGKPQTPSADNQPSSAGDTAKGEDGQETSAGKTLVVYFSGTGNTERVAQDIAAATGADLFEILPAEPYTSADLSYNDDTSRVVREHDDESLQDIALTTTAVENWADYDTVFLGYPIWWGIAAWPVSSFVKANDFTGKTVIPFATSASSGMGQSGSALAQLAGTGLWQEGQRFSSGVSTADVESWVKGLGL